MPGAHKRIMCIMMGTVVKLIYDYVLGGGTMASSARHKGVLPRYSLFLIKSS